MLLFLARLSRDRNNPAQLDEALARAARTFPQITHDEPFSAVSPSGRLTVTALGHPAQSVRPRRPIGRAGSRVVLVDGTPVHPRGTYPAHDAEELVRRWDTADELEGQFAALLADLAADRIECRTDALGLGPIYAEETVDGVVVSNSVRAIRNLTGAATPDEVAVASFLTLGWAVGGRTLVESVRALLPGSRIVFTLDGRTDHPGFTPAEVVARVRERGRVRPDEFVTEMVELTRAAVDSGLPLQCAVTAGRDSRTTLALCLAAGSRPTAMTIGDDNEEDVVIGRRVAERAGLDFLRVPPATPTGFDDDPVGAARQFVDATDGLSSLLSLQDAGRNLAPVSQVGLQAWGIGGEACRTGIGDLEAIANASPLTTRSAAVQARMLALKSRNLGGLFAPQAQSTTRGYLAEYGRTRTAEGWRPDEMFNSFFVFERVGRWCSAGIRRASPTHDLFSPFASRPYITASFAVSGAYRYAEALPRLLLNKLAPELADIEYGYPWPVPHPALAGVSATARAARLLWSRASRVRSAVPASCEVPWVIHWLQANRAPLREAVLDTTADVCWEFADRAAVERAFDTDVRHDLETAEGLLRLATVTLALDKVDSSAR